MTVQDVAGAVTVQVAAPGLDVTRYVAGAPPDVGGVIVTVADVAEATTAVGCPGAPGAASGVIGVEALLAPDVPAPFVAVLVNV